MPEVSKSACSSVVVGKKNTQIMIPRNYTAGPAPRRSRQHTTANAAPALQFRPITPDLIPELMKYVPADSPSPGRSADYTLGGIVLWARLLNYEMAVSDGTLFIRGKGAPNAPTFFALPLGNTPTEKATATIAEYCRERGIDGVLTFPGDSIDGVCQGVGLPESEALEMRDWEDYLYRIDQFCGFPGKQMSKKRNHLNGFRTDHPDARVVEIDASMSKALTDFLDRFEAAEAEPLPADADEAALWREKMRVYELEEIRRVLARWDDYPFSGIALMDGDEVLGFTFGEIRGDTLYVHVEKGNTAHRGVYQAVSSAYASRVRDAHPEVQWINREDDTGDLDLRKSKESYHPAGMVRKFILPLD